MHHIRGRISNSIKIINERRLIKSQGQAVSQSMLRITVQCLIAMVMLFLIALFVPQVRLLWVTTKLLVQQDLWLLEAFLILSVPLFVSVRPMSREWRLSRHHMLLAALALVALCYLGHRLLLMGYDLSRDEQMASFDAAIFSHGRLAWPLPPAWQKDAAALNLEFMLPVGQPIAWVSAYLPFNAALRAAIGMIADPALTGPLLTAGSLLLIWSIAKRVWPEDREAPTIAALLLLGSGQFVITGMTAYAMPGHLFFNLLWLRLFLADRRLCDGLAILVGFVATGLHQPLFHPMFVAPFLLLPLLERRWLRFAIFSLGYGAIGIFWLSWPIFIHGLVAGPASVTAAAGTDYLSRLLQVFSLTIANPTLTAANMLRFCTWQHLFLLPLMAIGFRAVRENRLAAAVAASFLLPIFVMAIILPYQGIGFGYRYLHGLLGNSVLLALFGWQKLKGRHEEMRPVILRATVASLLVLLPMQAWMAHARYAPFARASTQIEQSGADYFLIKATAGPLTHDLVLNRPDLSNRPLRLQAEEINDMPALARRICHSGASVALGDDGFYAATWAYFDNKAERLASANIPRLRAPFEEAGCSVRILR
ncbi:hypothetical protein Sphch_2763 [Sphingobium chlorophenolicum L-1]|uniref:Uncharacterized protein n=1 Tax=Sphingobium chlorophenolicum L-1 TaxID=690566 RepID=F6F0T1_SPHCR|nr:hypothetical protein [Sphingobium chlorophenolicum]AEG50403.1 hypothetical protein Sphch_2763 [Sphingobium chlorophenolicum L-1]